MIRQEDIKKVVHCYLQHVILSIKPELHPLFFFYAQLHQGKVLETNSQDKTLSVKQHTPLLTYKHQLLLLLFLCLFSVMQAYF